MKTKIDTSKFEARFGFPPAGRGCWNFGSEKGTTWFASCGTYTEVKRRAVAYGVEHGLDVLHVSPSGVAA